MPGELKVEVVRGTTPPGFTSVPEVMWVKISGGDHPSRSAAAEVAADAARPPS